MKTHELKLNIEFCDAVLSGEKTFEIRKEVKKMTCKDCIHYDMCKRIDDKMELKNMSLNETIQEMCGDFKDKSQHIEHPAYSNLVEAIRDVQDMIDVLDVTGSAYVYRHNGGRTRLANILSCLRVKATSCRETEIGSYLCYVNVPGYKIACDKCLATEIKMLNDIGVKTIGCCCGHQKHPGYIQIDPEHIEKMEALGYKRMSLDKNGNGQWCFEPKSILLNNDCWGVEMR